MTLTREQLLKRGALGIAALAMPGWKSAPALAKAPAWASATPTGANALVHLRAGSTDTIMGGISCDSRVASALWYRCVKGCPNEVFVRGCFQRGTVTCARHGALRLTECAPQRVDPALSVGTYLHMVAA